MSRGRSAGLIKAVDQYDCARQVKFETYAIALIRGAILELLRGEDWAPRSVRADETRLRRAYSDLELMLGRTPTDGEVAQHLGITIDELERLETAAARGSVLSLDDRPLCYLWTDYSAIWQLRGWLPPQVGGVLWALLSRPCSSAYVPLYQVGGANYLSPGPATTTRPTRRRTGC